MAVSINKEVRLKVIAGQGYIPLDVINDEMFFDRDIARIPLIKNGYN